ncbi:GNAT family N-acetyltransferase [Amorphus orientalis]|uniref:Ribosomal protein S18 acetylase RimI-like enzyme n=1 Tax=Amorphus orientalis TaxID=649198 RepID=A0AAE3VSS7_9HYPH|nr:GNAT family N-acetyltransferase [Amorphus orientalis]MDQ0317542.1 ribosomal protein S18 acetylase RimI-like enzyme [Amorphus orientalis]
MATAAVLQSTDDIETVELGRADIGDIVAVHRAALAAMPRSELVRPDGPETFNRMFDMGGEILGLIEHRRLAGYGMLRPERDGMGDREGLARVVPEAGVLFVVDGAAVHPEYWTRSLQRVLIRERLDHARRRGAGHVVATAAPGNIASIRNLLKEGFRVVDGLRKSYGLRYVLHRQVREAEAVEPEIWGDLGDLDGSRSLFQAGYCATRFRLGDDARPELGFTERGT